MLQNFLVTLSRATRGKASRLVEFLGIQTEQPKLDESGNPEFTKPREGSDAKPEPVMIDVPADKLPAVDALFAGIQSALDNSDYQVRLHLARLYNAIAFSKAVEATAAVVIDTLSPVFAEFNITDENLITTLRRNVSMAYNIYVKTGKIPENLNAEQAAEKKVRILRKMLETAEI